ncbi:MAG: hypothetical protein HXN87_05610 [Prevotella pallens]|uniref:hypothetical protein n=1 Tax=Prevotella pallens TaxID=60133 RepID=UPI001CB03E33|nr:hypothetical protein [Prevotella pallens]MBF1519457.1 hypothetical protein [Prevotella pallens]
MNIFKPQTPFTGIKQTDLAQAWQQNRETLNHISALFHVIIGGANSVAQTVMLDTIALLSKTNQYKGKARHNAHLAVKRYNNFDRQNMDDMRNKQMDKRQFYMDYLDDLEERLKPDVFRFRLAIKQVLDKRNIADSELKSYILCTYEMLHYCVTLFDRFIKELPYIPPINFKETYRAARLDGVFTAWDNLTDVLCRDCANIRLDDDPNCRLALNIIETKNSVGAKHKPKWQRGSKPQPHHTVGSRPCRNEPQPQTVPTIAIHRGSNGISKKQLLNHTKHRPCQNVRHQPIET